MVLIEQIGHYFLIKGNDSMWELSYLCIVERQKKISVIVTKEYHYATNAVKFIINQYIFLI